MACQVRYRPRGCGNVLASLMARKTLRKESIKTSPRTKKSGGLMTSLLFRSPNLKCHSCRFFNSTNGAYTTSEGYFKSSQVVSTGRTELANFGKTESVL